MRGASWTVGSRALCEGDGGARASRANDEDARVCWCVAYIQGCVLPVPVHEWLANAYVQCSLKLFPFLKVWQIAPE